MTAEFLIWSHHHQAWFAPNGSGYRNDVTRAGRFQANDVAQWLTRGCGCCLVPEVAVPAPPAEDLAQAARTLAGVAAQRKAATDTRIERGETNEYARQLLTGGTR